eukprot:Hpha_TRINITY_DN23728_c0_g1::TRINITY_DN23728_c0_g1_i1::g.93269::m.93269
MDKGELGYCAAVGLAGAAAAEVAGQGVGKRYRYHLDRIKEWAVEGTAVFPRQEALFKYLDRCGGSALRGWSVETEEPLLKRMRYGESVRPFDTREEVQRKTVPQQRFFVAATPRDMRVHLFGGTVELEEEEEDVGGLLGPSPLQGGKEKLRVQPVTPGAVYEIIREQRPAHLYFDVEMRYDEEEGALGKLQGILQSLNRSCTPSGLCCSRECNISHDEKL